MSSLRNCKIDFNKFLFHCKFSNLFEVVEEGEQAAVAAATHPKFKIRWLKCLNETARNNAMIAIIKIAIIKKYIAACYHSPSQNLMERNISNNEFDFDNENESGSNIQNTLGITACDIEFQRFCQEHKNDLSILHAYPIIKSAFLKSNTLLPSSAPVERLFSFATMFNTAKFNRFTDENFKKRFFQKLTVFLKQRKT